MPSYQLIQLSQENFERMEEVWQKCLNNSLASPLFSSWIWQKTWWDIWQPRLNLKLLLIGIYQEKSFIGIAPCYTYIHKYRFGLKVKRCELIGNYSASDDSIRSEYLNFILPSSLYHQILPAIFKFLKQQHIDEAILRDLNAENPPTDWLKAEFPMAHITFDKGIRIQTDQPFKSYLFTLGKNTRLKLYNRRKQLNIHYIEQIKTKDEIIRFFDQLNKMHLQRWGKVCFSEHSLSFHHKIAKYYLLHDQLHANSLHENSQIQAVCYDISVDNIRYNLQLGFYQHLNHKISMGTLMLGFAIEQSHNQQFISHYDLLAGNGKNTFYKQQFKGKIQFFTSFHIPLKFKMRIIYAMRNQLRKLKYIFLKKLRIWSTIR